MTLRVLTRRGLVFYWRIHAAVAAGVAIAVAVLAGALMVGDSVRRSLRELMLERLGNTAYIVSSANFFREELATDVPLILFEGIVVHDGNQRRASHVSVYGVDERFWRFHGRAANAPANRELLMSAALAGELEAKPGDSIQVRVGKPSEIPAETLHGRKEDSVRTLRFTFREVLGAASMGDFSLSAEQGPSRNVFVSLRRIQRDLAQPGRVNAFLAASSPAEHLRRSYSLADIGLKLRDLGAHRGFSVESSAMILDQRIAEKVLAAAGSHAMPVITYLANAIRARGKEIPYSLVTATDQAVSEPGSIRLNEWAARELAVRPGDEVSFDYYVWDPSGRLLTRTAKFRFAGMAPMSGLGGDRELAPDYPGISDTDSLADWDPPFPMDLKRIRNIDEDYWDKYRTSPKAFISLADGQRLWGSRFGNLTSIRVAGVPTGQFGALLKSRIDPLGAGFSVEDVRTRNLQASAGSTDFGEYFSYFSFFLVLSALLLAGLFFRFGVEQRAREIGLLRASGYPPDLIRRLMLAEALLVAVGGAAAGAVLAIVYGSIILFGLRTWWVDAVGTSALRLHVSPAAAAAGAGGALIMAILFLMGALRATSKLAPRDLLAGMTAPEPGPGSRRYWVAGLLFLGGVGALFLPGNPAASFFSSASLLLLAALSIVRAWLIRPAGRVGGLLGLGFRAASFRPSRSVLSIALIAFATFTIVAVDAFRRGGEGAAALGYRWFAESQLPVYYDLNDAASAADLGMRSDVLAGVTSLSFRLRAGEDASCLNLYQPRKPRILGVPARLWPKLAAPAQGGAVPAIADANSLQYVLHAKVGDTVRFDDVQVRFVDTLKDSVFQSEILISEEHFVRLFPYEQGYRVWVLNAPPDRVPMLEEALSDYGFDITSAEERLAAYHRVENTYLSTFQALGALGLLLGTAGLGAVLLRNLLERRRELGLLRAVGYTPRDLTKMVLAENAFLLLCGLGIGTACAALAVSPAWMERGGGIPWVTLAVLPLAVLSTGLFVSWAALKKVARAPVLETLRAE